MLFCAFLIPLQYWYTDQWSVIWYYYLILANIVGNIKHQTEITVSLIFWKRCRTKLEHVLHNKGESDSRWFVEKREWLMKRSFFIWLVKINLSHWMRHFCFGATYIFWFIHLIQLSCQTVSKDIILKHFYIHIVVFCIV